MCSVNILIQKGRGYHFGMKGHFYIIFNQPGKVDWESVLTGFVKTVGEGIRCDPVALVWEKRGRQNCMGKLDTVL